MGIAFLAFIPMSGGGANSAFLLGHAGILPDGGVVFLSVPLHREGRHIAAHYDEYNEFPYFAAVGVGSIVVSVLLAIGVLWIRRLVQGMP